jgi:diguanylate cyclase (GGDEF)-like protein
MTGPGADELGELRCQVRDLRRQLADAHARLRSIVERSADGAMVVDAHGAVVYANPAAHRLLGHADGELLGEHLGFPVTAGEVTEVEIVTSDRAHLVAEMRVVATEWDGRTAALALLRDITERHRSQAELAHRATHDALTGLPNRYLFTDRLRQALVRLQREHDSLAVVFADLDGFKPLNDRYGHPFGDLVLIEAARRLTMTLRPSDTAARLGGDEFVILCEDIHDATGVATSILARIEAAFAQPFRIRGTSVRVGISAGYAATGDPECDPEELLRRADDAMYARKARR